MSMTVPQHSQDLVARDVVQVSFFFFWKKDVKSRVLAIFNSLCKVFLLPCETLFLQDIKFVHDDFVQLA